MFNKKITAHKGHRKASKSKSVFILYSDDTPRRRMRLLVNDWTNGKKYFSWCNQILNLNNEHLHIQECSSCFHSIPKGTFTNTKKGNKNEKLFSIDDKSYEYREYKCRIKPWYPYPLKENPCKRFEIVWARLIRYSARWSIRVSKQPKYHNPYDFRWRYDKCISSRWVWLVSMMLTMLCEYKTYTTSGTAHNISRCCGDQCWSVAAWVIDY